LEGPATFVQVPNSSSDETELLQSALLPDPSALSPVALLLYTAAFNPANLSFLVPNAPSMHSLHHRTGCLVVGPAILIVIVDCTNGIGPGLWFLVVLVGLPAPFIWHVDVDRGGQEGRQQQKSSRKSRATKREPVSSTVREEESTIAPIFRMILRSSRGDAICP
jgi:hypothetical protein